MNLHTLIGAALISLSAAALAQPQSGSGIPASGAIPPTGTSGDNAGSLSTSPRTPQTSVGTSGAYSSVPAGPSTGRCDTLIGDERNRCLREQATAGTAGPTSSGMGSGAGSGASTGSSGSSGAASAPR